MPTQQGQCANCGHAIGGENHRFTEGGGRLANRTNLEQRTKTGHVLGKPSFGPAKERNMSPTECALIRIIMHSAMLMGACRNPQATAQLIKPTIQPDDAAEFVWEHLKKDFALLGKRLGLSVDDAALTVHLVLQRMISLNGGETDLHDQHLQTVYARKKWEDDFTTTVVAPVIKQLEEKLRKATNLLMGDERLGKDPLVRQLYEFDDQDNDLSRGLTAMSRSLWRYRRHINVDHLRLSFQQSSDPKQYKVLDAFIKQEHKLRSVQFLPDIIRLQQLLSDRFHKRIDKATAKEYTIEKFLNGLPKGTLKDEYRSLIRSFKNAWNACRSFLGDRGSLRVPEHLCNTTMDNKCPIAMLLPSTTGICVCSPALAFFLVETHNEMLGAYHNAVDQESAPGHFPVMEVTMSHLIAYDPERDLLPLILAHCNYSLELGKETSAPQYHWAALQRQLIDRFLRGRSFVDFKDEKFSFRRDTGNDAFNSVRSKIRQEPISHISGKQIVAEFSSSLPEICNVLSTLDIAIGFLASSGGSPEKTITSYLHEVLKLPKERGLRFSKVSQHCRLSHILALWRLMALEKAKLMSKEPFENLSEVFKLKLNQAGEEHLKRVLKKIDMNLFLPHLLQMIVLEVEYADENVATMCFREYFAEYLLSNTDLKQISGTEEISADVKMEHVKAVWSASMDVPGNARERTE